MLNFVSFMGKHHIEMPDGLSARTYLRQFDRQVFELLAISRRYSPSSIRPLSKILQLDRKYTALKRFEPVVVSGNDMIVLRLAAMVADDLHLVMKVRIIRDDRTAF